MTIHLVNCCLVLYRLFLWQVLKLNFYLLSQNFCEIYFELNAVGYYAQMIFLDSALGLEYAE